VSLAEVLARLASADRLTGTGRGQLAGGLQYALRNDNVEMPQPSSTATSASAGSMAATICGLPLGGRRLVP